MTTWQRPPNYVKQLDLYTEYAEDLNADSKFVIDGRVPIDVDEMWGISEYDNCIHDTIVVDGTSDDAWQIKDSIPNDWVIKDSIPPNDYIVIGGYDSIYLDGTSPPDIEPGRVLTVGNGAGLITAVDNDEITITYPYMEEIHEYQEMDKDFNKHLAHIIQQAKSELTKEVVAIGEGKCKSELIEKKIDWFINLLRKE